MKKLFGVVMRLLGVTEAWQEHEMHTGNLSNLVLLNDFKKVPVQYFC